MKIIQLTPENNASVAGLMKKVFGSYDWADTEMVIHHGSYSRKNKRLPKINNNTSQANFSSARATAKKSGIVVEARIATEPWDTIRYWIHFGESVMFNDKKIFILRNYLSSQGKFFGAFVPTGNVEKNESQNIKGTTEYQPTERALQLYAARH